MCACACRCHATCDLGPVGGDWEMAMRQEVFCLYRSSYVWLECCHKRALEKASPLCRCDSKCLVLLLRPIKNDHYHVLNTHLLQARDWARGFTCIKYLILMIVWVKTLSQSPFENHWFSFCLQFWGSGSRERVKVHLWCTWWQLGQFGMGIPFQVAFSCMCHHILGHLCPHMVSHPGPVHVVLFTALSSRDGHAPFMVADCQGTGSGSARLVKSYPWDWHNTLPLFPIGQGHYRVCPSSRE